MERIVSASFAELIAYAFWCLPDGIAKRIDYVHFLTGTDPVYAGLHDSVDTDDGRKFKEIAHFVPADAQPNLSKALRHPTIVLPVIDEPWVVVHELGHALDNIVYYDHPITPITEYAKINEAEAFAEAFVGWLFEDSGEPDKETETLFDSLC